MGQAEIMTACLPPALASAGAEIVDFLKKYGCEGYPADKEGDFTWGAWLGYPGTPGRKHEAVTIIPCFSDDVPPTSRPSKHSVAPGVCLYTDQVIILFDADRWSIAELALTLLHEGRHARHRIGPRLAQLPPLDPDDVHETNTWLITLNLLATWGTPIWAEAVQQEINWLNSQSLSVSGAGQIVYTHSGQYWSQLDQLFGPTNHLSVRQFRRRLVSFQANMLYWSQLNPVWSPGKVCHALVTHHYQ